MNALILPLSFAEYLSTLSDEPYGWINRQVVGTSNQISTLVVSAFEGFFVVRLTAQLYTIEPMIYLVTGATSAVLDITKVVKDCVEKIMSDETVELTHSKVIAAVTEYLNSAEHE